MFQRFGVTSDAVRFIVAKTITGTDFYFEVVEGELYIMIFYTVRQRLSLLEIKPHLGEGIYFPIKASLYMIPYIAV